MENQPETSDFDEVEDGSAAPDPATPSHAAPGHADGEIDAGDDAEAGHQAPPAQPPVVPVASVPPAPEPTGVPGVDAALARLADVESAPLDGHVEIFDDVQRQLHDALAELDDE